MTIQRFLGLLERHGSPALPVATWRTEIGHPTLAVLLRLGWLESRPLLGGGWFPCPSPAGDGCPRRVVELRGRLVAICGQEVEQCPDVVIADDDAEVLAATPGSIRGALAAALQLEEVERDQQRATGPIRLGERVFGEERAVFYFASHLGGRGLGDWIDATAGRKRDKAVALLVPRAAGVRADRAAELRRGGVFLLPLDRTLRLGDRRASLDLAEFVTDRRFAGVVPGALLWPRYQLVLDPEAGRYWFGGSRVALDGKLKTAAMLEALARRPGQLVTRDELCRAMWPESYLGRGTLETDWDRRIRGHKKVLGGLLEAAHPQSRASFEATSSGDETQGGYRLALAEREICWWSS